MHEKQVKVLGPKAKLVLGKPRCTGWSKAGLLIPVLDMHWFSKGVEEGAKKMEQFR